MMSFIEEGWYIVDTGSNSGMNKPVTSQHTVESFIDSAVLSMRRIRLEKEMTSAEFAQEIGISREEYVKAEEGISLPSPAILAYCEKQA